MSCASRAPHPALGTTTEIHSAGPEGAATDTGLSLKEAIQVASATAHPADIGLASATEQKGLHSAHFM
jgi:hypothetical protein